MSDASSLAQQLGAALTAGGKGLAAADSLCAACVDLLGVDGASITVVDHGQSRGTYGSSDELSRRLDALHFTYGEGPCLDAAASGTPVLVPDLRRPSEQRWPALTQSLDQLGVRAIFALPVTVAATTVAALDLYRLHPGPLEGPLLAGAQAAARLASLPLQDLDRWVTARAGAGIDEAEQDEPWEQLASLDRTEIYQATGILMVQADLTPAEALVRLRARAYTTSQTASEVAWEVLEHHLLLDRDGSWREQRPSPHHDPDDHRPEERRGHPGDAQGASASPDDCEEGEEGEDSSSNGADPARQGSGPPDDHDRLDEQEQR